MKNKIIIFLSLHMMLRTTLQYLSPVSLQQVIPQFLHDVSK